MGSLTSSPSSCSLNSQVGLTSVTSIQERIMSTPGGEEAIERLKVSLKIECKALYVFQRAELGLNEHHRNVGLAHGDTNI